MTDQMAETPDRTVHARSEDSRVQVVRYSKAGKWWREEFDSSGSRVHRDPLALSTAASEAVSLERRGGSVFKKEGGQAFGAAVRRVRDGSSRLF